jgi:hypothetical protein
MKHVDMASCFMIFSYLTSLMTIFLDFQIILSLLSQESIGFSVVITHGSDF